MPEQSAQEELKVIKIPDILPILPLFNVLVFPKMMFPMEIFGDQSITLVDEAMAKDRLIGLVMSKKPPQETKFVQEDFYSIGTSCVILKMAKTSDNKAQLLVQGINRFSITNFVEGKPYIQAQIVNLEDEDIKDLEIEALMSNLTGLFDRIVKLTPFLPQEFGVMAKSIAMPGILADMIASIINATAEEKQLILETLNIKDRLKEVTKLVNHQVEILELGSKIQSQVKSDMDKSQREYYLRQQLKAIQQELGETDESKVEVDEYREKIEKGNLPEEAKQEATRELERLSRVHPSSAEYTASSTYLTWST
ncbi:MAG: LON peptidase substrate-binding domain-containing protein, partial [Syntrophales bacterium]|nr:LON peptidase substrate-binding domain-containing protein [Syntrophales bacterium]